MSESTKAELKLQAAKDIIIRLIGIEGIPLFDFLSDEEIIDLADRFQKRKKTL